jgi:thioredoxin reductase (NADPH)
MTTRNEELVIIGSGPAGLTAAIYASRAHLKPLLVEGRRPGGQLMGTTAVENWPGIPSIMGPQLMFDMKAHAEKFGTRFLSEQVSAVDFKSYPFIITTDKGTKITAKAVITATGAVAKKLNIPGEESYWGKGVTTCAVCDGAFFAGKPVVIIGGGDSAMENASFMTKFTNNITVIHILDKLTASATMQERVLKNPNIRIIYDSSIKEIHGTDQGVTAVSIENNKTHERSDIQTAAVFIAIGYNPNTDIFKQQLELDNWGYIKTTGMTKTSVPGVFAAGDSVDHEYRQAITSAASGCMAALDAERWLRDQG